MSVSKPFLFALICQLLGAEEARKKLGANATGFAFNSVAGIERTSDGRTNPMVNAGAIATTSLVPGATHEAKWKFIHEGLSKFAGRKIPMNEEVLQSALETNFRNRSIAQFLLSVGRIYCDPMEAVDLYTRQCSLNVSAKDLAVMGATLADGGVNPDDQGARGRSDRLPLRAGCHDNGGLVRNVRRLALRHRFAGQERHRWGHRYRITGQRWTSEPSRRRSTKPAIA